ECTKHSIYNFVSYEGLSLEYNAFTIILFSIEIPQNIHTTLEKSEWRAATGEEIRALKKNRTWKLVDLLEGK
ncbi:hypothetical protein PanWU01x14_173960, partial [Parasponia andersonii]